MILNANKVYYLFTHRDETNEGCKLEKRNNTGTLIIRDFVEAPVFYYEFRLPNAFKVYPLAQLLSQEEIDRIKNCKAFLALNNAHESFHEVVEGLYESLVLEQNIPPEQIIIISESADIDKAVDQAAAKYNLPKMKAEWILQFEWNIQLCRKNMEKNPEPYEVLVDKQYDKKFLNFNRRWRPHRVALVALMKALGVLDKGHVSLGKSDDNNDWGRMWHWIKYISSHNSEISELLRTYEKDITELPPMYLDKDDLTINRAELDWSTKYLYENTYFSVISETNFYTNTPGVHATPGRFCSEKTFKPIAMKHPFIMVSVPLMLEKLKQIGYRSFSPYIDESYDQELDDNTRLLKIVKEIKRLSELSPAELSEFLANTKEIVEHNYNILMNKDRFFYRINYDESQLKVY